jgi:hypothetical protein
MMGCLLAVVGVLVCWMDEMMDDDVLETKHDTHLR